MKEKEPKMNIKLPVAASYLIFSLAIAICSLVYIPTPHEISTTLDSLIELEQNLQKAGNFTIFYQSQSNNEKLDFQGFLTEIFPDVKSTGNSSILSSNLIEDLNKIDKGYELFQR
jgi:hypothetical protein